MNDAINKIKEDLRIKHNQLDNDICDNINACLKDLELAGIEEPYLQDELILSAVKLYCRSIYIDDVAKSSGFSERYEKMKAALSMSIEYRGDLT